jgi:4-hydroxybenzoyl-CoA reductase subunit beta
MERMSPFALRRPASLAEAVAMLAADPRARAIAGGTDLVPNLRDGLGAPAVLVDLSAIAGLDSIETAADGTTSIGAGVSLARLARDEVLAHRLPALREAAESIAGPAHRTVATVGGNLCLDTRCVFYNQSAWWRRANAWCLKHGGDTCHVAPQGNHCHAAFAGDLAPALIALAAEVEVAGPAGTRRLPLEALYVDDGAAHLALAHGELVAGVHIPAQPPGARSAYRKVRVRGAIDFPLAGVAARLVRDGHRIADLRVAITGTNSRPLLLAGTGTFAGTSVDEPLLAALAKLVQKQVSPMRTTLTASNWRRTVAAVTARRLVADLAAMSPKGRPEGESAPKARQRGG